MLIKIDCREKELLDLLGKKPAPITPIEEQEPGPEPEPDHYIMDLGDGMTMKVPLPKNKATKPMKPKLTRPKSLDESIINHEVKSERLPLGDIILHDPTQEKDIVLFERKTLADLAASIRDGRYKEQSFRLIETAATTGFNTHHIVYVIEGDLSRYDEKHSQITKTALQSAMVSLLYYKGFSVVRTMNVGETASFILHFADKVQKEGPLSLVDSTTTATAYSEVSTKKEKRDYITRENIGEIMLAQIPGVSPKIAASILSKYSGSLYEFLADLHRKISDYEESVSPEMSPPSPQQSSASAHTHTPTPTLITPEPMNKNKLKHVSACFKDVGDGKRGIGKATIEKLTYFLS